jgi:hypothetical protein
MRNPFRALPQDASPNTIYGAAGRLFEERTEENRFTNFNTEIWYLAGDAMDRGFDVLKGMTKEQVARQMGNFISMYLGAKSRYNQERRRY